MLDLTSKNPDQIKQELDSCSEELAHSLYEFRRCEEFKKITFSQITLTNKMEKNCSVAEAEKHAYCDKNYKIIIEGLLVAEKNYSIAKGKYSNLQSWCELYRSWLVTNRELSR
jgi:hypothetical protein